MTTRVALVTGGSSGIGEHTARLLQEAGFTTYAVARRVERMQALADAGVTTFALDVTDPAAVTAAVDLAVAEFGRIDVLVNNAGYGSRGAFEEFTEEQIRAQFEVNVFGLARLTQLVTPHMRAQRSGRIINISSIGGKFYEPFGAWYHATKFAVEGFSDSLRMDCAPFGIQVVLIEPGPDPHRVERDRPRLAGRNRPRRRPLRGARPAGRAPSHGAGFDEPPRRGRAVPTEVARQDREGRAGEATGRALPGRQGRRLDHGGTPGAPRQDLRLRHQSPLFMTAALHRG